MTLKSWRLTKVEIVVFFVFIAVCGFALVWASRKTKSEDDLAHKQRVARRNKLLAPRDTVMAHKEEVWTSRRQHATVGVTATNRFVPKSETSDVPEYDGFSRRDRHHVRERTAQVKEDHPEELLMTAIQIHSDEERARNKAAS